MASTTARRIVVGLTALLFAAPAFADWGGAHWCRLSEDRFALFTAKERFVLTHGGAWELADSTQQADLDRWLKQSKLSPDLGQVVSNAPIENAYQLASDVRASDDGDSATKLTFRFGQKQSSISLEKVDQGAKLAESDLKKFDEIAKSLGKPASTLLVMFSDTNEKVSDTKAWGLILGRLKSKTEFFQFIDKKHGLVWVHRDKPLSFNAEPMSKTGAAPVEEKKPKPNTEKPSSSNTALDPMITTLLVGIVCLGAGGGAGYFLSRKTTGGKKIPTSKGEPKFTTTARERELVEFVRAESGRLGRTADAVPSAEETVVNQIQDRYRRHESLTQQIEQLQSYRKFAEDKNAFQKLIDDAVLEARNSQSKAADAVKQLQELKSNLQSLSHELDKVTRELDQTRIDLADAEKLNDEMSAWIAYVSERLETLTEAMQHE